MNSKHGSKARVYVTWPRRTEEIGHNEGDRKMSIKESFKYFQRTGVSHISGEHAKAALNLARAESMGERLGLTVTWELEQDDWMMFAGDPVEEYRRNFESGKWECFCAYVEGDDGLPLASLGGIVLSADSEDYRRCIEAELLSEAIETLKKGDES